MIDFDFLSRQYFWFDKPVLYQLKKQNDILIYPILVQDSEIFLSCIDLFMIDKNDLPNPEFISMSYLDFIFNVFIASKDKEMSDKAKMQFLTLLKLCLGWENNVELIINKHNKLQLLHENILLNGKDFEDIRKIILYQNFVDYDDSYINPDLRKTINEMNELKFKDIDFPTMERKMAIITAHCGLSKKEQMQMTFRSHSMLFKEVCGEVDYSTFRTAGLISNMFSKKSHPIEDWIYKKKHNKYEQYFTTEQKYNASMGGGDYIQKT